MYFVTVGREGYVLFSMTPSEKAAIGLTEKNEVHILQAKGPSQWEILAQWKGSDFSHTDFMSAMHEREEPAEPAQLLEILPEALRARL
jgi:hypothetical protein